MSVTVTCPGCRTSYPVTEDLLGKKIRCKKCQETFTATAAKTAAAAGRAADERIQTRPGAKAAAANGNGDDGANGNGRTKPARKPQPAAGNNKSAVLICAVAGALVVGMGGITLWALNRPPAVPEGPDITANTAPPPRVVPTPPVIDDTAGQEKTGAETAKAGGNTDTGKAGVGPGNTGSPGGAVTNPTLTIGTPVLRNAPRPADFRPGIVERVKKSAVLIKTSLELGLAYGSGWMAEKHGDVGYIITNAHVVHMKEAVNPPPEHVEVIFDSGTPQERPMEAKILALDREEDLAVLRVQGKELPDPLPIVPSYDLMESQRLLILGFPRGGNLKDELKRDLGVDAVTTLKARLSSVAGRVHNKDGSVKYIQVEGGADPGNSGGAVVDTNGNVCAVLVAGSGSSNMRFVIPSEYVVHLLHGRLLKVIPGQAVRSGGSIRQPLTATITDPLSRLSQVRAEVWVGAKPDEAKGARLIRPGADRQPDPLPGDGARARTPLAYSPDRTMGLGEAHTATGELTLPPVKDDQVYWFQPHYTTKDGKQRWGEAVVLEMGRYPVDAKPVMLALRHKEDRRPDDMRHIELTGRQAYGIQIEGVGGSASDTSVTAALTERTMSVEPSGDAKVRLQYNRLGLSDTERDSAMRRQLRGVLEQVKNLKVDVTVTRDGRFRSPVPDWAAVAAEARLPIVRSYNSQVLQSLELMALSLPNKEVQPGETWMVEGVHTLNLERNTQNAAIRLTCKYVGTRVRNGREEAVIELTGQVGRSTSNSPGDGGEGDSRGGGPGTPDRGAPDRGDNEGGRRGAGGRQGGEGGGPQRGLRGVARGAAVVDLATGQVLLARTESDVAVRIPINVIAGPRGGRGGVDMTLDANAGLYVEVLFQRSLTKDKPAAVDPRVLLPNQPKVYNPVVGVGTSAVAADVPGAPSPVPEVSALMAPEILDRVKKSAVFISVDRADGGGEGSGWFAEPGIVVTNAHVVGMLEKSARLPEKIVVVLDSGLPTERRLDGKLIAVDRAEDLAVLRVESANLPEPLKVVSAADLVEAHRLTVLGFPQGTDLAEGLGRGLGVRDLRTTLKVRPTTVAGRVYQTDQSVKYIQLEGGADQGNSGGAVVDDSGNVRAVLVAASLTSTMRFAIPGEYAARILQGYPLEVTPGRAWLDGSVAKQPVEIKFADPLKRTTRVALDYWVGSPGKPRKPTEKAPKSEAGDDPRNTVDLKFTGETKAATGEAIAAGEFALPEVAPGRVLWIQPRFINGTGQEQWGQANSHAWDPPVKRVPALLAIQHKRGTERTMELTSKATFRWHLFDKQYEDGFPLRATLVERTLTTPRDGSATVQLQYTDLVLDLPTEIVGLAIPSEIREILRMFTNQIKAVIMVASVTREGVIKKHQADYRNLPIGPAIVFVPMFNEQIIKSLSALCIPLPNKQVDYGHTWEHPTNLFIETRNRYEAALFTMKFKYVGVRERGGRQEAVVEIEGALTRDPNAKSVDVKELKDKSASPQAPPVGEPVPPTPNPRQQYPRPRNSTANKGLYGQARGYALVDVAGGYVSEVKLFIDMDAELTVKHPDTKDDVSVMAGAVMELLLKRLTAASR